MLRGMGSIGKVKKEEAKRPVEGMEGDEKGVALAGQEKV